MKNEELKPCPFCGGRALGPTDAWPHMITCEKCGAGVKSFKFAEEGKREAVEKWNRRVAEDATTAQPDKPRVMTLREIQSIGPEDVCGIVEILEEEHMYGCIMRRYDEEHVELICEVPNLTGKLQKDARIWTARPTNEQRRETVWDAGVAD